MAFWKGWDELSETRETNHGEMESDFDKNVLDEYDKLFGDRGLENRKSEQAEDAWKLSESEVKQEYDKLFGERKFTDEKVEEIHELTGWTHEILDVIGSLDEAEIYIDAGLTERRINGKNCLVKTDIDMDQTDEDGISNREKMERGRPPITKDGKELELHHIGQKPNSPLAELTMEQHRGVGNDTVLHDKTKETEINRNEFAIERKEHWKSRVE